MRSLMFYLTLAGSIVTHPSNAQPASASSCDNVYVESTKNVVSSAVRSAEMNSLYKMHCSASGQLNSASSATGLSGAYLKITGSYSNNESEVSQRMTKFCKEHHESGASSFDSSSYSNTVVVDALKSYNDCVKLERQGVIASHSTTDDAVLITFSHNPATTNFALQAVLYDPSAGTCNKRTDLDTDELVVGAAGAAPGSIVVACKRTPEVEGQNRNYRRFSVLIGTNHGDYAVTLPQEEVLGFESGNVNRAVIAEKVAEASVLRAEKAVLSNKISDKNASIDQLKQNARELVPEVHLLRVGDSAAPPIWEHVTAKPNDGRGVRSKRVKQHAERQCAPKRAVGLKRIHLHSGGCCGFGYWVYTCID